MILKISRANYTNTLFAGLAQKFATVSANLLIENGLETGEITGMQFNFVQIGAYFQSVKIEIAPADDSDQSIQDLMFVFDNLEAVDDRGIQTLLREISTDTLIVALKACEESIKEKICQRC